MVERRPLVGCLVLRLIDREQRWIAGGGRLTPGFQHNVAVPVSVSVAATVTVSVKTVSVPAVPYAVAGACARQ